MPHDLYLGVDLGTTGVKVGLFEGGGTTRAVTVREFALDTPAPGFLEFDADRYVGLAFEGIGEVLSCGAQPGEAVAAIGVSSQAQTFVVADSAGRPLRPAVSWLDVRAPAESEELGALADQLGHVGMNAVQSGPKLLWLMRHEAETMARLRRFFVIPDYFIFRLTGRSVTDYVFAASTGCYDTWRRRWVAELIAACRVSEEVLPEVVAPGTAAGHLTAEAARTLGLPQSVIVAVGTNDQPCGALGAGNVNPGCASVALGTALAIILTGTSRAGLPRGVGVAPHPATAALDGPGALYSLLAYAKTSGIVIRWFRDTFAPGRSYEALFAEAASAPIGAAGVTCLPHLSGTATPDFNPLVRGAFSGISLAHGRPHFARALLESLAFTIRENLDLLGRARAVETLRAIGGGSKSDIWLQMIADVTGMAVERPETGEAACLGAAELGMAAAGRYPTVRAAALAGYRPQRRFEPQAANRAPFDEAFARYRHLFRSLYGG